MEIQGTCMQLLCTCMYCLRKALIHTFCICRRIWGKPWSLSFDSLLLFYGDLPFKQYAVLRKSLIPKQDADMGILYPFHVFTRCSHGSCALVQAVQDSCIYFLCWKLQHVLFWIWVIWCWSGVVLYYRSLCVLMVCCNYTVICPCLTIHLSGINPYFYPGQLALIGSLIFSAIALYCISGDTIAWSIALSLL